MSNVLKAISLGVAALMLTGCAQTTSINDDANQIDAAFAEKYNDKIISIYQCQPDNKEVEVRYFPTQGVAVLVLNEQTHELHDHVTASGFWYTNGKYTVRGKGQTIWLEIGRMAAIECKEKLAQ